MNIILEDSGIQGRDAVLLGGLFPPILQDARNHSPKQHCTKFLKTRILKYNAVKMSKPTKILLYEDYHLMGYMSSTLIAS